ncbi:hypothetical protein HHK36_028576 [Tetracentron sinense]|uniref:Uncharacterized protein n=1 Tax=Tetracentron sinense TaxID=13715 RepID=A0A835D0D0_TETSI|nr:hypothetical protein HHK36_028576 [Tetracentron sinense]
MSRSIVDPHDKIRARDVNKVARGEQAPRSPHEPGSISKAPSKPETCPIKVSYTTLSLPYVGYRCVQAKGGDAPECEKFARYYRSLCPDEWVSKTKPISSDHHLLNINIC